MDNGPLNRILYVTLIKRTMTTAEAGDNGRVKFVARSSLKKKKKTILMVFYYFFYMDLIIVYSALSLVTYAFLASPPSVPDVFLTGRQTQ